ncbi:hypothetical protein D3C78_1660450 [compost metagenome]
MRKDSQRLDFLIANFAVVRCGGKVDLASEAPGVHGYWLDYPLDDVTQAGVFATPRDAIDTAISAKK